MSVFSLHSISATSISNTDELTQILSQYRTKAKVHKGSKISSLVTVKLDDTLKLNNINGTRRRKPISVTKKPSRFKDYNKHVVLEVLEPILKKRIEKNKMKQEKLNPYLTISASDLVHKIMSSNIPLNQCDKAKPFKIDDKEFKDIKSMTALIPKSRLVRSAILKDIINKRIDEKDKNNRDLVLESVSRLIENEKLKQRFDLVNPPNSQFSKRQQLLWERIRIKAAEELLLHPKPLPQRATERIYDTLKMDLELEPTEAAEEPGLFKEFKNRIEKQYYLDWIERGQGRVLISTLKPYY
ncbi:uncharacterized protein LOC134751075 [Cydia strobilella]|uniref:uncharacterized protein LOC134751075 n=1 Tax=Cydia strobilella TaxID=1100964 RepID=UPI0030059B84